MKKLQTFLVMLVIFCLLAVPGTAFAKSINAPTMDDKVVFGGSFTLESGETLNGSLIVLGGVVLLDEGSCFWRKFNR